MDASCQCRTRTPYFGSAQTPKGREYLDGTCPFQAGLLLGSGCVGFGAVLRCLVIIINRKVPRYNVVVSLTQPFRRMIPPRVISGWLGLVDSDPFKAHIEPRCSLICTEYPGGKYLSLTGNARRINGLLSKVP